MASHGCFQQIDCNPCTRTCGAAGGRGMMGFCGTDGLEGALTCFSKGQGKFFKACHRALVGQTDELKVAHAHMSDGKGVEEVFGKARRGEGACCTVAYIAGLAEGRGNWLMPGPAHVHL